MRNRIQKSPDHRQRVGTLLGLLADEEAQSTLSRRIGRERLAFELARAWFDQVYVPSNRYLAGLKGDFSTEAAESFMDDFDPVELAAMERFHRFFELRIEMIPGRVLSASRIPTDERWEAIMRDAGYLLDHLGISRAEALRRLDEDPGTVADLIRIGG